MSPTPEITALLPLPPRDFLILLALVDTELHGYGLLKAVEEESGKAVRMDPANLYRSLRRMARDGLVEEVAAPASEGGEGGRRRYYRLTVFGRRLAQAEAVRVNRLARSVRARKLIEASGEMG